MELQIKADLTQTLCVRQMHELIEIDIREGKKFTCLFINKEQAKMVIAKLQECVGETSNENGALPIPDVSDTVCEFCNGTHLIRVVPICKRCQIILGD